MVKSCWLIALACPVAVAAASDCVATEGTCVQDAVSAVQARRAVPEVHAEPDEIDGVDESDENNPGLLIHKELHLEVPLELAKSRLGLLATVQRGKVTTHKPIDCEQYPHLCQAPFNCQNWTLMDTLKIMSKGFATADGHPNPRAWCLPGAQELGDTVLKECVVRRNTTTTSAILIKERSAALGHEEMDASFCFAEGHCSNKAVTATTTVEETEAMCDKRFGRNGWTTDLLASLTKSFAAKSAQPNLLNLQHGFNSREATTALTKMSCAMGVYHCDVLYCKHTYCKDRHYKTKYSFLKRRQSGRKLKDTMDV